MLSFTQITAQKLEQLPECTKGFFTLLLKAQRQLKLGQKKSGPAPGACSSMHMDIPLAGATVSNPNTYDMATGANQQLFPSPPAEK